PSRNNKKSAKKNNQPRAGTGNKKKKDNPSSMPYVNNPQRNESLILPVSIKLTPTMEIIEVKCPKMRDTLIPLNMPHSLALELITNENNNARGKKITSYLATK